MGGIRGSTSPIASIAPRKCWRDFDRVRRNPVHSEYRRGPTRIGVKVGSNTGPRVKRMRAENGVVIHNLRIAVADGTVLVGAFRFEPELIHVVAKPTLALSAHCASYTGASFRLTQADRGKYPVAHF
jgi:hypothetical protein